MIIHVKHIHRTEKQHACVVCSKLFPSIGALRNHNLVHTTEKKYSCGVCEKSFTRKLSYQKHQMIHTGEKNMACSYCPSKFICISTLKRHSRIDTEEKLPFSCDKCAKAYVTVEGLENHKKNRGKKPFKC